MTNEVYDLILKSLTTYYFYENGFERIALSKINIDLELGYLSNVITSTEDLISNYCSDIRIVSLYIYASTVWLTKSGVLGLFPLLKKLCQDHFDQILPSHLSDQAKLDEIDFTLDQLFRRINRKLSFIEKHKKSEVMDLLATFDENTLSDIQVNAQDFSHFLLRTLSETRLESVNSISVFYENISRILNASLKV